MENWCRPCTAIRFKCRSCNTVEVHCTIVDLKTCINDGNRNHSFLNHRDHFPHPAAFGLVMTTTSGCILVKWTWRFREVIAPRDNVTVNSVTFLPSLVSFISEASFGSLVIFLMSRPDQHYLISTEQVPLNLTYQAWLRNPWGSCLNLSLLDSSLLKHDKIPQLLQICL